jgi:hypothetical protein
MGLDLLRAIQTRNIPVEFTVNHIILVFPQLVVTPMVGPHDHLCTVPLLIALNVKNHPVRHTLDDE